MTKRIKKFFKEWWISFLCLGAVGLYMVARIKTGKLFMEGANAGAIYLLNDIKKITSEREYNDIIAGLIRRGYKLSGLQ